MKTRFLLALPLLCVAAHAQSATQSASDATGDSLQISTDRPGFANGAGLVPLGHLQLEAGATAARSGDDRSYSFGQLLVRVPASKRAEVRVGVPSYLVSRSGAARSTGADNLFLEGKFALSSQKRAAYALLVNAFLPTGSRGVTTRSFQPGVTLAADLTFSQKLGSTLNLGYVRGANSNDATTGTGGRFNEVFGAASLNYALTQKTGAFGEFYAIGGNGETQKYFDGGFTQLLGSRTQLDASAGVGLGNKAGGPDYFYVVGVSRLF